MKIGNFVFSTLCAAAALFCASPNPSHASVVTYIDLLNTTQSISTSATNNYSTTNSTISTGLSSVGGFRTMTLTSTNNDINEVASTMRIMTNAAGGGPRMVLSSGNDATANFEMAWGGATGTGFAPVDFTGALGTNFSLIKSTLNFSLRTADSASPYTWTFRDTNNVTATYASTFPINTTPSIDYAISLASFANGGTIDWSAINFITLSGGGIPSLDLVLGKSFSVTATPIPEPGTWAAAGLLVLTAFYIRRRRMRATTEEAPAAA